MFDKNRIMNDETHTDTACTTGTLNTLEALVEQTLNTQEQLC